MNHYTGMKNGLYATMRGGHGRGENENGRRDDNYKTFNNKEKLDNSNNKPIGVVEIGNSNRILKANIPIGGGHTTFMKEGQEAAHQTNLQHGDHGAQTIELIGRSWAADTTAFAVPLLRLGLDAGSIVIGKKMKHVFITHCHADHCHDMTHLESITKPPHFYVPLEMLQKTKQFLRASAQLTCNVSLEELMTSEEFSPPSYTIQGVTAGERIVFDQHQQLVCHVVQCDHSVPTVGYCFSRIKHVLKPEFENMSNVKIGELRREGVKVTYEKEDYLFCYLGDTSTSILRDDHPSSQYIFRCPTIIIECTFLTEEFRQNAKRTKHVLWNDLKPYVLQHPQITFVLIHFSHRYHVEEVRKFFDKQGISNVIPWIPNDPHLYCHKSSGNGSKTRSIIHHDGGDEREVEEVWSHF